MLRDQRDRLPAPNSRTAGSPKRSAMKRPGERLAVVGEAAGKAVLTTVPV
jgi:hypothetical protein